MRVRRRAADRWELRPRRRPVVGALVASVALAVVGMWLGGPAGVLAVICFAATAGVAVVELWRARPVLVVSHSGMLLHTSAGVRRLSWPEIEAVTMWTALRPEGITEDRLAVMIATTGSHPERSLSPVPVSVTETDWDGGGGGKTVAVRSRLAAVDGPSGTPRETFVLSEAVSLLHCTVDVWELRALFLSYGVSPPIVDRRR